MMRKTEAAEQALAKGEFVLIYDGSEREGEADLMFHARFASPEKVERLRRDAGGLICMAMDAASAEKIGLLFMTDVLRKAGLEKAVCRKTAYGDEPAFSLAVNYNGVYTGIPDKDRALTISEMAKAVESPDPKEAFWGKFYSPGHLFLLISRGLEKRRGHTELGVELAKRAGMSSAIVMCEMLGSGSALPKKEVRKYAERNGFPFLEGADFYE